MRLLLFLVLLAPGVPRDAPAAAKPRHVAKAEKEVLDELNLARQQPRQYAGFIKKHRKRYRKDGTYRLSGRTRMKTQEGIPAVDEAIAYLMKIEPVGKLTLSSGLSRAAADHAEDLGPKGKVGHTGTDGSTSEVRVLRYGQWKVTHGENVACGFRDGRSIVMQLIIDDGVPNRGHRTNIFNPAFKTVGIALARHKVYRHICVMDFAGGFDEKGSPKTATQ